MPDALDWLQRCGLASTDELTLNHVTEYLALARVLGVCDRREEALELLERLNRLLSKEDRLRDRIKVLILRSLIFQRQELPEAAFAELETALDLSEKQGYIRSYLDEGELMARLLTDYVKVRGNRLKHSSPASLAYAKRLLQAWNAASAKEPSDKERLTEQEKNVLRFMAEGLSNKEIAPRLHITSETVKFHLKNIYRKLGAKNRVQALQRAAELMMTDE
jgi:LuxR family maltose regulon positive regulatory protein